MSQLMEAFMDKSELCLCCKATRLCGFRCLETKWVTSKFVITLVLYLSLSDISHQVFTAHSTLLEKGFALSHPPTIMQALEGNLPFCWQSNERSFLKDFVACTSGTSGGRLARYAFFVV